MRSPRVIDNVLPLLIFLLPSTFQLKPPAIPFGSFYITLVEVCLIILLVRWFLDILVSGKVYSGIFDRWFLLFFAYLALSLALGLTRFGTTAALGDFRQFLPLFLYFWAMRFYSTSEDLALVRRRIFHVMIVVAIYVLFIFLFLRGAIAVQERMAERVFFDNTLFLLMIYGSYLLGQAVMASKRRGYIFTLLALNALMLLVMQVRTYWIAFAIVVGATAWQHGRSFLKSRFVVGTIYILITAFFAITLLLTLVPAERFGMQGFIISLSDRIDSIININQSMFGWASDDRRHSTNTETVGTRFVTAQTIFQDYITKEPLLGTGIGGELPMMSRRGAVVMMKYQVDSGYVTILAKFGVVGMLLYGVVLWRIVYVLMRIVRSPYATVHQKMLSRSFIIGILALLAASFFSSIFIRQQPALLAFIFMIAEIKAMERNVAVQTSLHKKMKIQTS